MILRQVTGRFGRTQGELQCRKSFNTTLAIARMSQTKLVCRTFAGIIDEILVSCSRESTEGWRLTRIACEPTEASLRQLKALAANRTLRSIVGCLICSNVRVTSMNIRSKFEEFPPVIKSFPGLYLLDVGGDDWSVDTPASHQLFFAWYPVILKAFAEAVNKKRFNGMLDVTKVPLSVLSAWPARPYKHLKRGTLNSITRLTMHIKQGETENVASTGEAWQRILRNVPSLQYLCITHYPPSGLDQTDKLRAFISSCLTAYYWSSLDELVLDAVFATIALKQLVAVHSYLTSLRICLNSIDFADEATITNLLDYIRKYAFLFTCSVTMEEPCDWRRDLFSIAGPTLPSIFRTSGKYLECCPRSYCGLYDIGHYVLGDAPYYNMKELAWCRKVKGIDEEGEEKSEQKTSEIKDGTGKGEENTQPTVET